MIPAAVDSSVLIAILNREPEAGQFLNALESSQAIIGWPTLFETRIWIMRRNARARSYWLETWLNDGAGETIAFDGELEALAGDAYRRFGKGLHPAGLNFGDCMAYAVARKHDAPLLFKGSDFARTDVTVHPASVVPA